LITVGHRSPIYTKFDDLDQLNDRCHSIQCKLEAQLVAPNLPPDQLASTGYSGTWPISWQDQKVLWLQKEPQSEYISSLWRSLGHPAGAAITVPGLESR